MCTSKSQEATIRKKPSGSWKRPASTRKVQLGTQRRSYQSMIEGIAKLRDGLIGEVRFARTWYNNARGSIGRASGHAPIHIDYELWQGPAPRRPYQGQSRPLQLALGLALREAAYQQRCPCPRLGSLGTRGRLPHQGNLPRPHYRHFDDDQESPDTAVAQFDFWRQRSYLGGSSCLRRKMKTYAFCSFYGDGGTMAFDFSGYKVYDTEGIAC